MAFFENKLQFVSKLKVLPFSGYGPESMTKRVQEIFEKRKCY